ncbi:MAG: hypothetical protein ABFQ89_04365 [Chloroflexota bacterium]
MPNNDWRPRILLLGGIVGAVLGVMAAQLYIRVAEESGGPSKVSSGRVLKLAVAALGVVREASLLGG